MMRYGMSLLASSFASQNRPVFTEDICRKVTDFLTEKRDVPEDSLEDFKNYIFSKSSSPKYNLLRQALKNEESIRVENQDLLLSNPKLLSSPGAMSQFYFEDALYLAQMLKLVRNDHNLLLARGRLSLLSGWHQEIPFQLNDKDSLYLGLWLLDVDGDWVWAFLSQIPDDSDFEINSKNRIELLIGSWELILKSPNIQSNRPQNAKARTRLIELKKATERHKRKPQFGQSWSWFLVPRLELLVDAGILIKENRHSFSGYKLTSIGREMQSICKSCESGESILLNYFFCRASGERQITSDIEWEDFESKLEKIAPVLRTSVGYFPIFETAVSLCVDKFLSSKQSDDPIWEINNVKALLREESKSASSRIRLAIDRQGQVYAFKIRENGGRLFGRENPSSYLQDSK